MYLKDFSRDMEVREKYRRHVSKKFLEICKSDKKVQTYI